MERWKAFLGGLAVGMVVIAGATTARADGWGSDDADTLAYGWIYGWGMSEGGGWGHPSMPDGVGACVWEFLDDEDEYWRGDYRWTSYQDRTTTWYVYGMADEDYMYTADTYNDIEYSGTPEVVCVWVAGHPGLPAISSAVPPPYDNVVAHGDAGSPSSGSADVIWASPGGTAWGNGGSDWIFGSGYGDYLEGEYGDDVLSGYYGDDILGGGYGDDRIYCGPGNDIAWGDSDEDMLAGGPGDDILDGGSETDEIFGDYEDGVGGNFGTDDECYGGNGTDWCDSAAYPYYCETHDCENP